MSANDPKRTLHELTSPSVENRIRCTEKWYRKAAEQGVADAQNDLGFMYENGQGVPQDYAEAVGWFRKAAEQGYANAQYNLGNMYRNGHGVERTSSEGLLNVQF